VASLTLVHPLFLAQDEAERSQSSPYFPLGLLYLAGYVRERGHTVTIFDGTFETDESAFDDHLARTRPDIVGISALISTKPTALRLAATAASFGATVIVGGPDPTTDPAGYLAHDAVDLVVHHEGEQSIGRLLDLHDSGALALETLVDEPGVAFRAGGKVQVNQPRPPIENLDTLPLPARDLIDMERYLHQWQEDRGYTSITMAVSRGCPFNCDWCRDAVHGADYRRRSPESVAAEMKQLKDEFGVDSIRLVDDVDGIDDGWFEEWADEARAQDAVITFEPLNDPKRLDIPLLEVRDSL
jgi:radical SAM superfamily enzyme YgiQ (UPF0313 family)